jgi:hypothetical protein
VNVTQNVVEMANEIKLRVKHTHSPDVFGFEFLFHHEKDVSHEERRKIHLISSSQTKPKKRKQQKRQERKIVFEIR